MRWVISDSALERVKAAPIAVRGKSYRTDPNDRSIVVGDLVLDRGDGLYGWVASIREGFVAVAADGAVELGVPLDRLLKLTPVT